MRLVIYRKVKKSFDLLLIKNLDKFINELMASIDDKFLKSDFDLKLGRHKNQIVTVLTLLLKEYKRLRI